MSTAQAQAITYEAGTDLIAESEVEERLDLGYADIYRLKHPERGAIIVFSSSSGDSAVVPV